MDRLYGPGERRLSALHDNFDPSSFHTPVSNIAQQKLVNTLTHCGETFSLVYSKTDRKRPKNTAHSDIELLLLCRVSCMTDHTNTY